MSALVPTAGTVSLRRVIVSSPQSRAQRMYSKICGILMNIRNAVKQEHDLFGACGKITPPVLALAALHPRARQQPRPLWGPSVRLGPSCDARAALTAQRS